MTALALVPEKRTTFQQVMALALNTVSSPETRRHYETALAEFLVWRDQANLPFNRAAVFAWRAELERRGQAPTTVNVQLSAVRKLAREAAHNGYLDANTAASINQIPNVRQSGNRSGNWLTQAQAQALIEAPEPDTLRGKRDRCALALLVGCALRRNEAAQLTFEHIQQREGRWVILDMRGKRGRIRTVPVPAWVKVAIDHWAAAAGISTGRVLRGLNRTALKVKRNSVCGDTVLQIARRYGREIGVTIKAHDLRRTCAKLCRSHGGKLEQIQLLLGHASINTTELYLGTTQELTSAPNDRLGLKWRDE